MGCLRRTLIHSVKTIEKMRVADEFIEWRLRGAVGQVEQKVEPAQTIENEDVKNG